MMKTVMWAAAVTLFCGTTLAAQPGVWAES